MTQVTVIKEIARRLPLTLNEIKYIVGTVTRSEKIADSEVSIVIVSDAKIQQLNARYRNKNKTTDILSFSMGDVEEGKMLLGDIFLAPDYIKKEAKKYSNSLRKHYTQLLIHGTYHLLGYDHLKDTEFAVMEKKEQQIFSLVYKKLTLKK